MYTIWVFSVQKRVLITRVQKEISARVYINICTYKHINTYIYKYINKKKPQNSLFLPQNQKKLRIFLDESRKMRIFAAQKQKEFIFLSERGLLLCIDFLYHFMQTRKAMDWNPIAFLVFKCIF